MPLLHDAAKTGNLEEVQRLLGEGYDVNELDQYKCTALYRAASSNELNVVKYLLNHGADVNVLTQAYTPLNAAAINNNLEMVKSIIAAKPTIPDDSSNYQPLALSLVSDKATDSYEIKKLIKLYFNTPLPADQSWLIKRINYLGYNLTENGICFGDVMMALQAYLVNESQTYEDRQTVISNMPESKDEFIKAMDEIKQHRVTLIDEVKQKNNLNQPRSLIANEELLITADIEKIDLKLSQLKNELNLTDEELLHRRKQLIFFAFVQHKINERLTQLNTDDQLKFSIAEFFDGISVYHQLEDKKHLFSKYVVRTQSGEDSSQLVGSIKLDNHNMGLQRTDTFSSCFNTREEIRKYFDSLVEAIKKSNTQQPFVFTLSGARHRIMVGYDPSKNSYIFLDPNSKQLPRYVANSHIMSLYVETAFEMEEKTLEQKYLFTTVFSNASNRPMYEKVTSSWQHSQSWTPNESKFFEALPEANKHILLQNALLQGDIKTVKTIVGLKLIVNAEDLEFAIQFADAAAVSEILKTKVNLEEVIKGETLLTVATTLPRPDIAKELLAAGANPINDSTGLSPFIAAVISNQYEILNVMLPKIDPVSYGSMAIDIAIEKKDIALINLLLNYKHKPSTQSLKQLVAMMSEMNLEDNIMSRSDFMKAWTEVYPPGAIDLRKIQKNNPAYLIYQQIKNVTDTEQRNLIINNFISKYTSHPLAEALTRIKNEKLQFAKANPSAPSP